MREYAFASDMAEDNAEELPAEETSEAEEPIYDTVIPFDKAEQKQRLAVEELVHTEASYVQNLQLCIFDIRNNLQKKQLPEIDLEGLFSNVDDVLCVSKHLLKGLEAVMNHEDEQLLRISTLFQEMKEEMENVYKIYCGDYDQALLLLDIYRKDPRLQKEIADTLSATVPHTGASDLSFFLVMPVQRISKYPLLLQKILENTPDTDSAYRAVQAAATAMTDVNANINEYKRRKEVANKYNKPGYLTLRERLARLNTHSIAKKTTRLSRLFMHEAGIVPKTEDKEFDELEERFQCLASAVTELKENVASFLNNTEAFLSFKPHKNEMEIGGTDQQYSNFSGKLHSIVFPVYKDRLECLVHRPLCNLSETLKGPKKLIRKRVDKLLDYEEIEDKRNETGSVTYEEEAAINTYLAINSLLVSELPVYNQVTLQWLQHILHTFAAIQRDLAQAVLQEADTENGQLPHRHLSTADFWKVVKDTFSQAENQLCSFQRKFETVMPSPVAQSLSAAEERKVLLLVSKHGAEKLYQVISNVSGSRDMDLTLQRGQIVALLHDKDTKGNANRWLVDAGGPRGYVTPGKLQPYHHVAQNEKSRVQMVASAGGAEKINHAYSLPQTPSLPVPFRTPTLQVVAGYPFAARSTHEVSLQAGQPVTVLEPHDKKGSKEWSLVEANGQRGYVPSSYLVMLPVPEPPGWSAPAWSHQTQGTSS